MAKIILEVREIVGKPGEPSSYGVWDARVNDWVRHVSSREPLTRDNLDSANWLRGNIKRVREKR